jgi:hypothetical protein
VVQIVKVLDGLNRFRFASEPDRLAAWVAASNIIGPPGSRGGQADRRTGGSADSPGEIKPAA